MILLNMFALVLLNPFTLLKAETGFDVIYDADNRELISNLEIGDQLDFTTKLIKTLKIEKLKIYTCKKIVALKLDRSFDYAIINLDRNVEIFEPLKLSKSNNLKKNDRAYVIGHSLGIQQILVRNQKEISEKSKQGILL